MSLDELDGPTVGAAREAVVLSRRVLWLSRAVRQRRVSDVRRETARVLASLDRLNETLAPVRAWHEDGS